MDRNRKKRKKIKRRKEFGRNNSGEKNQGKCYSERNGKIHSEGPGVHVIPCNILAFIY